MQIGCARLVGVGFLSFIMGYLTAPFLFGCLVVPLELQGGLRIFGHLAGASRWIGFWGWLWAGIWLLSVRYKQPKGSFWVSWLPLGAIATVCWLGFLIVADPWLWMPMEGTLPLQWRHVFAEYQDVGGFSYSLSFMVDRFTKMIGIRCINWDWRIEWRGVSYHMLEWARNGLLLGVMLLFGKLGVQRFPKALGGQRLDASSGLLIVLGWTVCYHTFPLVGMDQPYSLLWLLGVILKQSVLFALFFSVFVLLMYWLQAKLYRDS